MPSNINTFAQLITVLTMQKANLSTYFTQCNASGADVGEITSELNNLTAIATYGDLVNGYKKTIFEIKQALYDGKLTDPLPPFPAVLTPPVLSGPVSGSLTRTRERNARFKAGPGYTDAIGDALGIGPGIPGAPPVSTPTVDVIAAESGYLFSVVISNRQSSDQWELFARPISGGEWASMGSRTTKSGDFTYNPGPTAGDQVPVQLQIRVQLKKNDVDYAPPSDIVMATVNP